MANRIPSLERACERVSCETSVSELKFLVTGAGGDERFSWQAPGSAAQHAVASSTKMVASVLLLARVAKGELRLEQPLVSILPRDEVVGLNRFGGIDHVDEITVRDALAHTSGIPDYYEAKRLTPGDDIAHRTASDPGWDYHETLEIARGMQARFAPHSGSAHYSATNYQLVGRLIEIVTGMPIADALRADILDPLGMADTWLLTPETIDRFGSVSPLLFGQQSYLGVRRLASLGAEGALVSTTSDMMRFMRAVIEGVVLPRDMLDVALSDRLPIFPRIQYGVGVMTLGVPRIVSGLPRQGVLLGHAGMTGHVMFADPVSGVAVTGTINQLAPSTLPYGLLLRSTRAFARR